MKNENGFMEIVLVLIVALLFMFNAFLALQKLGGL